MRFVARGFHHFDGDEATGANLRGELPDLVREAGFDDVEETERWSTPFGTLTFLRARRGPADGRRSGARHGGR
jgi:hypothetical protein